MFKNVVFAILVLGVFGWAAGAQQFMDGFNYPSGTTIPGYTEHVGDWKATGAEVQGQSGKVGQTLIHNQIQGKDACVEVLAIFDPLSPTNIQRAGPIARFTGSGSSASYFYLKVQDNGSPYNGFDYYFVYYQGGSSVMSGAMPETKKARVRLQVVDEGANVNVQVYIDTDMDGLWNVVASRTSTNGLGVKGGVGINGSQSVMADDFKFFNATLYLAGTPKVGTSVNLKGRASANQPYVGGCSFGHTGTPLTPSQAIPIDLDNLFALSITNPVIFGNFLGLTDGNGDFTMTLNIPAIPQLAGITIWSTAVTATVQGIMEIAPDVEITFTT
jgi:hypothetical protein